MRRPFGAVKVWVLMMFLFGMAVKSVARIRAASVVFYRAGSGYAFKAYIRYLL
tara:strand:- start:288 stop:446 length:159 start_codon:yes stop_codon:yes gene_type:complete